MADTIQTKGKKEETEMADEIQEGEIYTLTDEEGTETRFELIGSVEMNDNIYYALVPEEESEEYVILKLTKDEAGEDILITIEDDDEFDRVADYFEDELFDEIDYDEGE